MLHDGSHQYTEILITEYMEIGQITENFHDDLLKKQTKTILFCCLLLNKNFHGFASEMKLHFIRKKKKIIPFINMQTTLFTPYFCSL